MTRRALVAGCSGVLFTLGLNLAGMTRPEKILGFLDVTGAYTGGWDPSLIVTMLSALAVHAATLRLVLRRGAPVLAPRFVLPTQTEIDRPLVVGSLLWGAGWGITGLCPGPILAAVGDANTPGLLFFAAMILGMYAHRAVRAPGAG